MKQQNLNFDDPQDKKPKSLGVIQCFECKERAELDGYRYRLVPLCRDCRSERVVEITRNRFKRRQKK
jgi:hypothetical protein